MTEDLPALSPADELAKIKQLFGPPPLLRSESAEIYNAILAECIQAIKPRNFLERLQVRHMANELWKIERHNRHEVAAVDRREQSIKQLETNRAEFDAVRKARANERAEMLDVPPTNELIQQDTVYEAAVAAAEEDSDLYDRFVPEMRAVQAMEQSIGYVERLERLIDGSHKRLNDSFNQIERYRQSATVGLPGSRIIDAKKDEIESIPDAPPLDRMEEGE